MYSKLFLAATFCLSGLLSNQLFAMEKSKEAETCEYYTAEQWPSLTDEQKTAHYAGLALKYMRSRGRPEPLAKIKEVIRAFYARQAAGTPDRLDQIAKEIIKYVPVEERYPISIERVYLEFKTNEFRR